MEHGKFENVNLELVQALLKASAKLKSVGHDKRAQAGRQSYGYSSAEKIFEAAQAVMTEFGLALIPLEKGFQEVIPGGGHEDSPEDGTREIFAFESSASPNLFGIRWRGLALGY